MEDTIEQRFLSKFSKGEKNECWEWKSTLFVAGYGKLRYGKKIQKLAHRFSYEYFVGPIPTGLVIDHTCENRKCVNPEHLEPTTIVDNIQRTYNRGKPRPTFLRIGGTCRKMIHKIESEADIRRYPYGDNYCRKCRDRSLSEKRIAQMKNVNIIADAI